MFLLALQLGGNQYPWDSATIWGLFDGAFLGAFFFFLWERHRGERALMPTHIIGQRIVVASMLHHACIESTVVISVYYLPYYFQSALNKSPVISGVDLLPSIASQIMFAVLSGIWGECSPARVCSLPPRWWPVINWFNSKEGWLLFAVRTVGRCDEHNRRWSIIHTLAHHCYGKVGRLSDPCRCWPWHGL